MNIADVVSLRDVEVKSGYISRTEDVLSELRRNAWLVANRGWEIHWHFDGTPSGLLLAELEAAGITWSVRDPANIRDH